MSERSANVWYDEQLVGILREKSRELYFTYSEDWLSHEDSFPVSVSLPLGEQEAYAHPFFSGLLPEADRRVKLCRKKRIDVRDDAGLLFAIGEDCAGALSIMPETSSEAHEPPSPLTQSEITKLASTKGELAVDESKRRFSLAGAQEKQSVIYDHDEDSYALPNRHYPSTHILKFETHPLVCFAEIAASQLAASIGLPVVNTKFLEGGGKYPLPFLRIDRYDRIKKDDKVLRLHQEDLLQALGEPTALKYQSDGGPGLAKIAELLRTHSSEPGKSILQLRDWQLLNYLIGNWDGHTKNLALLYKPGNAAPQLSPCYDIVAVEYLNVAKKAGWGRRMALRIGNAEVSDQVKLTDWHQFAHDLSIPPKTTMERLAQLTEILPDAATKTVNNFTTQHGTKPVYDHFPRYITKRCKRVKQQLSRK
ncbi:MAG: HipA domain-containing protein [Pseudohongiellaceae bacterium]